MDKTLFVTTDLDGTKHIMDAQEVDAVLPLSEESLSKISTIEEYVQTELYATPEEVKMLHDRTYKAKLKSEKQAHKKMLRTLIVGLQRQLKAMH